MATIINFQQLKNRKNVNVHKYLPYDDIKRCVDLLEVQIGILKWMYEETEFALKEVKIDPSGFTADSDDLKDYLESFMNLEKLQLPGLGISFYQNAEAPSPLYRTMATAMIEKDSASVSIDLFKWDGEEWLIYDGKDWIPGPGANFF